MFNSTTTAEFSQKIQQDDHNKFSSSKLVSKQDTTNPSFRIYYGNVSGAIPFTWEIQPGTPKHNFSNNSYSLIPPLTPPPAYYFSNPHQTKPTKRKSNLLYNLLFNIKKGHVASSSSPSSSLSSSSWSSLTSSSNISSSSSKGSRIKRRRFASFGSSFDDGYMYDGASPDSVVCFGMNSKKNSNGGGGGGTCAVVIMKKAFLSIVGRRSV